MRALWTEELVTVKGRSHRITDAGLNPLPVQQPIPIWIGGSSDVTLRRVAKMGDGWFPQMPPNDRGRQMMADLRRYLEEEGRDPASVGIEARVSIANKTPDEWRAEIEGWKELGATHLGVNTMGAGIESPAGHIEAIRKFRDVVNEVL
jgi:alkanesulfonate monooxygenase SsuD/methylene tetrahydromethanopterin reductase-like flavin-dependent oxidoreductase (luciferase family)